VILRPALFTLYRIFRDTKIENNLLRIIIVRTHKDVAVDWFGGIFEKLRAHIVESSHNADRFRYN